MCGNESGIWGRILSSAPLLGLILASSAFVYCDDPFSSSIALISAASLWLFSRRSFGIILLSILSFNTVTIVLGNWLFSSGSFNFSISPNVNGFEVGLVGAAKRNAMILLSFAWVSSIKSPKDLLDQLSIIRYRGTEKYILVLLRELQITKSKYVEYYYFLKSRASMPKGLALGVNLRILKSLFRLILKQTFRNVARVTYLAESHFTEIKDIRGQQVISIQNLSSHEKFPSYSSLNEFSTECSVGKYSVIPSLAVSDFRLLARFLSGLVPRLSGHYSAGIAKIGDLEITSDLVSFREILGVTSYVSSNLDEQVLGMTVEHELSLCAGGCVESDSIVQLLAIGDLLDRSVDEISGGQMQKLIIAKMLLQRKPLNLIADSFNSIDLQTRSRISDRLGAGDDNSVGYLTYSDNSLLLSPREPVAGTTRTFCEPVNKSLLGIEIDKLTFAYNESQVNVFEELNLTIPHGALVNIVGSNGAGKSTLAKLILGIDKPTAGSIRHGFSNPRLSFQGTTGLCVEESVGAELSLNRRLSGKSEGRHAFHQRLRNFIPDLGDEDRIEDLSLKRKIQLSIISTAMGSDFIIFDEPLWDDAELDDWFEDLIEFLNVSGITMLIVSHDKKKLKNRGIVLNLDEI